MERTRVEVALDRFGFVGVPMTVPGFAEAHELVPEFDDGYVFEKTPFQMLRAWWMNATKEPLYIHGPWGCGKTSSVEQFFARLERPGGADHGPGSDGEGRFGRHVRLR